MTPTQRKALEIIRYHAGISANSFAKLMWPDSERWKHYTKKGRGSSRGGGMAVAAGCYVGKLKRLGWVRDIHSETYGTSYAITNEGIKALNEEI